MVTFVSPSGKFSNVTRPSGTPRSRAMPSASGRFARPLKILSLWLFPFPNTAVPPEGLVGRPALWGRRHHFANRELPIDERGCRRRGDRVSWDAEPQPG